jgi:hypothetical protein
MKTACFSFSHLQLSHFSAGANVLVTSPARIYSFQTVANVTNMNSIVFSFRGTNDATLLLADDAGSEPIEIVIGGWWDPANGNSRSNVRRSVQGSNQEVWPITNQILNATEDRFFWIRWSATQIAIGQVCDIVVFSKQD